LSVQHEPYWRQIHEGLFIGYRKGIKSGKWISRKTVDGKYIKKSLGVADDISDADGETVLSYKQAQDLAKKFDQENVNTINRSSYTIHQAVNDYLSWHKITGKSYKRTQFTAKAHILKKFKDKPVCQLTTHQINKWFLGLVKDGNSEQVRKSKSSANRILTVLKAALNYAWNQGRVESRDAWDRIKPFRGVDAPKIRYLTEDECRRLIDACEMDFKPLVRAVLMTGCRYGELISATVQDFDSSTGILTIPQAKSGKSRHIPLTKSGQKAFSGWVDGKHFDELIFKRLDGTPWGKSHQSRRIKEACEIAGLNPPCTFHNLRDAYASVMVKKGVSLQVVSELLGHSDVRMTQRHYAHLQPGHVANTVRDNLPDF